jgi:hypothetical protein
LLREPIVAVPKQVTSAGIRFALPRPTPGACFGRGEIRAAMNVVEIAACSPPLCRVNYVCRAVISLGRKNPFQQVTEKLKENWLCFANFYWNKTISSYAP